MTGGRRARKTAATRRAIQDHALRLFLRQGYDATTVEQIAAAAGVSHMTFFRHFPRKESVVEYDEYDPMIVDLIAARPEAESALAAVHGAVVAGLREVLPADRAAILQRTRLILRTPALLARSKIAEDATRELFATALARRAELPAPDFGITVQAAAAVAALTTAIAAWSEHDDADLVAYVDEAFAALDRGG